MIKEIEIENILFKIGIPIKNQGFKFIIDAIMLMDENGWEKMNAMPLYAKIAEINRTTSNRVERAIRYVLQNARKNVKNPQIVTQYLGHENCTNFNSLIMLHTQLKRNKILNVENSTKDMDDILDKIRKIIREELNAIIKKEE